jgi:hypothetical protein
MNMGYGQATLLFKKHHAHKESIGRANGARRKINKQLASTTSPP